MKTYEENIALLQGYAATLLSAIDDGYNLSDEAPHRWSVRVENAVNYVCDLVVDYDGAQLFDCVMRHAAFNEVNLTEVILCAVYKNRGLE